MRDPDEKSSTSTKENSSGRLALTRNRASMMIVTCCMGQHGITLVVYLSGTVSETLVSVD